MSPLLVKVYKAIFTAPSSAADVDVNEADESDVENIPPVKKRKAPQSSKKALANQRTIATRVNLNEKVTPRSIAYVAVILHFNLQTSERWDEQYGGFDYRGLYNYVIDFFEDVDDDDETKKRAKELLKWWDE